MGKTAHRASDRGEMRQSATDIGHHRNDGLVYVMNALSVLQPDLVLLHGQILDVLLKLWEEYCARFQRLG